MTSNVVVVGAGIVGLACACAAVERGLRVQVIDRDVQANSASIRNFGFVTVTGQGSGTTWQRARRSRDIWARIAPEAGIDVEHQGLFVLAQREESQAVLQRLCEGSMGQGLEWLSPNALRQRAPHLAHPYLHGALYSPHELRIESRIAIERLRRWLASRGVEFFMGETALDVTTHSVRTARRTLTADRVMVCPGADLRALYPDVYERRGIRLCQLHMLRVQPPAGYRLGAGVMSDLSLVRYRGYEEQAGSQLLLDRLRRENSNELHAGVHLIVVQSADGSLVVGDSHDYGQVLMPFARTSTDELILAEMQRLLCLGNYRVTERWTGIYPSSHEDAWIENAASGAQLVCVTSGTGMSTAFALAEEALEQTP